MRKRCANAMNVSIHVPARGTTESPEYLASAFLKFQSTFPHGERQTSRVKKYYPQQGFNPRSRTGNDIRRHLIFAKVLCVSIHVPARGTTSFAFCHRQLSFSFQSTFPHGERRNPYGTDGNHRTVSIHVPARGTTRKGYGRENTDECFNPRSRTGNDSNHPQISFVLFALIYAIIPINSVQRNLQHALLLTSPQNYSANPPGILCSLQTRTTLSLRCLLLKITKNIHCTTS